MSAIPETSLLIDQDENQAIVTYQRPDQKKLGRAREALAMADAYKITNATMYQAAAEDLKDIKSLQKQVKEQKESVLKPLRNAVDAVRALFSEPERFLERAEDTLKRKMVAYTEEEERKRKEAEAAAAEAARKQREQLEREAAERAAKARAEAEKLRKQAEEAAQAGDEVKAARLAARAEAKEQDGEAKAADLQEQAALIPTTVVMPASTPKVSGQSLRGIWKVKSIDLPTLVKAAAADPQYLAYLEPAHTAINSAARTQKDRCAIPGVEVYEDKTIASRSR